MPNKDAQALSQEPDTKELPETLGCESDQPPIRLAALMPVVRRWAAGRGRIDNQACCGADGLAYSDIQTARVRGGAGAGPPRRLDQILP